MIQQTHSYPIQGLSICKPIDMDEFKGQTEVDTIFRTFECDVNQCSSPTVAKANPITGTGDCFRVISPLPYFKSELEVGESSRMEEGLGCDWAMEEEDMIDAQPIEIVTPLAAGQSTSLYSFYFEEESPMDQDSDDLTISLDDEASFEDEEFCLENLSDDPASFWETGVPPFSQERRLSPAQISIASIEFNQIDPIYRAN
jgi:hypothetical protein